MKELLHRRRNNRARGTKVVTISSRIEDLEGITRVRKSFLYNVVRTGETAFSVQPPEIYIRKFFDTEKKIEKFLFHVKGNFYTTDGSTMAKVYFHHSLNVQIAWKKVFLPPKVSGSD